MHIEAGIVQGAKILLSYGTAVASFGIASKLAIDSIKTNGLANFAIKTLITSLLVLMFFEVFPHQSIGISEVHLILGSTLFLVFGAGASAFGLAIGLLAQGLLFAPIDLPQYGMNITTLLMPLFAMAYFANKIIPQNIAYKDLAYNQVLKLSLTYQSGIVLWVAFWAIYGQGFGSENLASIASFGIAYMSVIAIEPIIDLAVLYYFKSYSNQSNIYNKRLFA